MIDPNFDTGKKRIDTLIATVTRVKVSRFAIQTPLVFCITPRRLLNLGKSQIQRDKINAIQL